MEKTNNKKGRCKFYFISNHFKYKWIKHPKQKAKIGRIDTITWAHITTTCCLLETYFRFKDTNRLKVKRWKCVYLKQILPKVPNLKYNMYLSEKADLMLHIKKTKIRASGLITSWQIEGEKDRSSDRFYFLGLQNHCKQWL